MSANWWASKLGAATPTTRTESTPPTYRAPNGIRIAAQPQAPPPQYSRQQTIPVQEEPELDPNGQIHFMDAMRRWKGTRAAQAIDSCPACGSPHVFAVQRGVNGAVPAPRCTACGWNGGLFEQGEQANWV